MTDEQQNSKTTNEGKRIPLEHVTIEYDSVEGTSFVASSAVSSCVLLDDDNGHDDTTSSAETISKEWKISIKIGQGTVIHPLTNITFVLPTKQLLSRFENNEQSSSDKMIVINIGTYNLIQECCTLELTFDTTSAAVEWDGASWNWNVIGHYNKFGPKTKFVGITSIGNDNVFDGCNVIDTTALGRSTSIGNCVVMTPGLTYRPLGLCCSYEDETVETDTTKTISKDKDDLNHVILFQLPRNTIHRRTCSPMPNILEQQRHQLKELAKSHLQHLSQHHKSLV